MNAVYVTGYAHYLRPLTLNVTQFRLSVKRVGVKIGMKNETRFWMNVKMFGNNPGVEEGSHVLVCGRLDGHLHRKKAIREILCDASDVYIRRKDENPISPIPPGYPIPEEGVGEGEFSDGTKLFWEEDYEEETDDESGEA